MRFEKTIAILKNMEAVRTRLEAVEECLEQLSDDERMVLEMLCIRSERGTVRDTCDILNIEKSSVYRIKRRALGKLEDMFLEKGLGKLRDDFS